LVRRRCNIRLGLDVGQGEGGELGAAQRAGEAEQDQGGVPGAVRGAAVDGGDDPAQLGHGERAGRAAGCGAENAAQSAGDLADRVVVDRVRQSVAAVPVADRRAGRVDAGQRAALVDPLGEVGAHRGRVGRQRGQPAPGTPALPLAPRVGVDLPGGRGVRGPERGGNPGRVVHGEPAPRIGGGAGPGAAVAKGAVVVIAAL